MNDKEYERLLFYLQKLQEYYMYLNMIILGFEYVVFRPEHFPRYSRGYSVFIGLFPLILTKCLEFSGDINRVLCTVVLTILTGFIYWLTWLWFGVYSYIHISQRTMYVLYAYTYILCLCTLWIPGFHRYLSKYKSKYWFNPQKRKKEDFLNDK